MPINLLITRPDIVYVDGAGTVWNAPAAIGRPSSTHRRGGSSRSTRRPDVVPGVSPFIKDGGLAVPEPGGVRDPAAGHVRQPGAKRCPRPELPADGHRRRETHRDGRRFQPRAARGDLQRVQHDELRRTTGLRRRCPTRCPGSGESATQANRVQPGQPYTAANAGTFGRATSTVGRTVGLGTNRQVQFAVRVGF